MPKKKSNNTTPQKLRPYLFHGVILEEESGNQAIGDCPFCGSSDKFFVNKDSGLWDCKPCGISGNASIFIRQLWLRGSETTPAEEYSILSRNRNLLYPETLIKWEVVKSPLRNNWLVPAYNTAGNINQLYRYTKIENKMRLLATPEMSHQLFGSYNEKAAEVYFCEGPWDAMALHEVLTRAKNSDIEDLDSDLIPTSNFKESWASDASVLATPGCNAFPKSWVDSFGGKYIKIMYDNDHPREQHGKEIKGAGYLGAKSLSEKLATSKNPPASIEFIKWGTDGHDSELASGFDVRDFLSI